LLGVESDEINNAADLTVGDYLLLTMQSSGYQPVFQARLHPHWEAALMETGTDQITVGGALANPKDYRRLT
jgi:hypothetical protein